MPPRWNGPYLRRRPPIILPLFPLSQAGIHYGRIGLTKAESGNRSSLEEGYLLTEGRETIGTSPIDAAPEIILKMPDDSYTPFFVGLFVSLVFVGMLLHWWNFTGYDCIGHCRADRMDVARKTLAQRLA